MIDFIQNIIHHPLNALLSNFVQEFLPQELNDLQLLEKNSNSIFDVSFRLGFSCVFSSPNWDFFLVSPNFHNLTTFIP